MTPQTFCSRHYLSFQIEAANIQDIDLSRFVPQEVDHTGITVASTDRFSRDHRGGTDASSREENNILGSQELLNPA